MVHLRRSTNRHNGNSSNSTATPDATLPLEQLEEQLAASPGGLSQEEAQQRLEQYGYNEIAEQKENPFLKFAANFWGPIPWMIEVAALLSGLLQRWPDLGVILTLLVVNAAVRFREEYHAGSVIAALKEQLALKARALRDGGWGEVPARELVPGDVIRVRLGDVVPADARLLEGDTIDVDQSALTGESLPVTKSTGDPIFSGSVIKQGEIEALVYATGEASFYGKTAHLAGEAHAASHLQRAVMKIADFLIVVTIGLAIIIMAVALFRGDDLLHSLQFTLVLAVAAIPAALPAVLSITMAVGAQLLAKSQAIVTRLAAIEELASIDVLCSDKTGTLTQNRLTLGEPFTVNGTTSDDIILAGALASREENADAIDQAVLGGLADKGVLYSYRVTHFQPFDPVSKRTEAAVYGPEGTDFKVTKGAPQVILALATNTSQVQSQVDEAIADFASRGFRSLGVARTDAQGHWQFLGVLPLYDPPRKDSKETIETAQDMGIRVKMVTGDQVAIGKEIARELGLGTNILDAQIFEETQAHQAGQLADTIEQVDGFAQVFPEHKYHIVDVLQQRGHIVAMTGDGVNDAPALNKADAGVAVSGATDAARVAASIVLLTPGLSVIIKAIQESRKIFQRMKSYVIYRIAESIRVLLFLTLSVLIFNFEPVTAIMIVLLALLNDGAILSLAYDNTNYSDEPDRWHLPSVLGTATILGVAGVVASFTLFYLAERVFNLDRSMIQTLIYLKLSVAGQLTIFVTRTRGPFWSVRPAPILLIATLGAQSVATPAAVYGVFMTPIGWQWALLVWAYALAWFLVNDRVKLFAYQMFDHGTGIWAVLKPSPR